MVGINWNRPAYTCCSLQARIHLEIWRELSDNADHVASRGKKTIVVHKIFLELCVLFLGIPQLKWSGTVNIALG